LRLLFVVQRYGHEVFGGAEVLCRQFATRLAANGHDVHVLTSCAINYVDWANAYAAGDQQLDGVQVHRLPVGRPRDNDLFNGLNTRALRVNRWLAPYLQEEWMRQQGPWIPDLGDWLGDRSREFDAVSFITYLYYTTWRGLRFCNAPSVLHPTLHDEPPAYLPLFDEMFRLPHAFAFLSEEEADLVRRRYRVRRPSDITGVGVESELPGDPEMFRRQFDLGDAPYIVTVGRTDLHKGSVELVEYFNAYKRRRPGPLRLVIIGEEVEKLPRHRDIVLTGFVSEDVRDGGIRGAELLVQPSYFESFSIVLIEGWVAGVPALVQGRCDVLVGQARRSGGGLPYIGYAEFEAGLDLLLTDASLRQRMAEAGRAYVQRRYMWPQVLARYERLLNAVA
jgi:glycosyltransferase involved in cell wall biosynthesis